MYLVHMVKTHSTVSLDAELLQEAKDKYLNISNLTERAIRERLNKVDVEINKEIDHCELCDRKDRVATKDDLKGLTWLFPDEIWICESCLKDVSARVAMAMSSTGSVVRK